MRDIELLTLAAKAIGEQVIGVDSVGVLLYGIQHAWNPLDDDGDALRLAVKLEMVLDLAQYDDGTLSRAGLHNIYSFHDKTDPLAATRRAIVMTAAEVGRRKSNAVLSGHHNRSTE